jgi:glycosyltransferase involved in cell wall biosynthesis
MICIPVFHDAFLWEYPTHYSNFWHKLFKYIALPAAKSAPFVITPTNFASEKIALYTGISLNKIVPVYEAAMRSTPVDSYHLPTTKPFILHVGTFEKRKNLPTLINAYHKLITETGLDYDLVLVGQSSSKKYLDGTPEIEEAILNSRVSERIHKTGYITDGKLEAIYKHASLYVFPSLNEGFGIPVIEAFNTKVPVIIANNSCLPEIAGNAALSFNPLDSDELYEKMKLILTDPILHASLIEKGLERAKLFNWETASVQIKTVFKKAVNSYLRPTN